MTQDDKLNVLFIAGMGRSGSTLLDRILGHVEGFYSMGELCAIWHAGMIENRLCGCSVPFSDCPFWSHVLDGMFAPSFDPSETLALRRSVDRSWRLPQHLLSLSPPSNQWKSTPGHIISTQDQVFSLRRYIYGGKVTSLIERVSQESGAGVLIDSSKQPGHGFSLLAYGRVNLHVIHLVRDARAVAHSWTRVVPRPDAWGDEMERRAPLRTALVWGIRNLATEALGHRAASYQRIRYEDFVAGPKRIVQQILEKLDYRATGLDFLTDQDVDLQPQHLISGNPSKFAVGKVPIRLDNEWEIAMPTRSKELVTAFTWPFLLRYGYRLNLTPLMDEVS